MLLHDALHDCQPQTGPVVLAGKEGVEDVLEVLGADPVAGIFDADNKLAFAICACRHVQPSTVGHGLDRVQKKVQQLTCGGSIFLLA